jgi:glyoxylase-like metal-dependent hydrolase (beta-lactamase superfamily II)
MLFVQIKEAGDNFSYLIADESTKEAAIVDPSQNGSRISRLVKENNLKLKYILVTHHHRDHLGDSYELRSLLGGLIVAHESSVLEKDVAVADGEVLEVGSIRLKVIHTPGHTPDGICVLADGKLMTGDTLFIGECGRTDLPGGDPSKMYDSLFHKLAALDGKTEVYPGHDYGPTPSSTLEEQRRTNYTLKGRTIDEFIEFMAEP